MYRQEMCPVWVTTLQQAGLFAGYVVLRVAAYCHHTAVNIAFNNDTARAQCLTMHALALTSYTVQQRILRRIFWVTAWANIDLACFPVLSAFKPADSLSRLHDFWLRDEAVHHCERHQRDWAFASNPFTFIFAAVCNPPIHGACVRG